MRPAPAPFVWPEEPESQLGWAPGSLSDDRWVGSGNLALRDLLPTEMCLLLAGTRLWRVKVGPWDLVPSSSEQRRFGGDLQEHH